MTLREWLVYTVFPPRCVVCREPLPRDRMICPDCEQYVNHPAEGRGRCAVCGLPKDRCGCGKKLYYEKLAAPFLGDTPARDSVYEMKFGRKLDLIRPLARFMKLALDERALTEQFDLITFIPMSRRSQRRKGYNHAEELAKELAALTGKPCLPLLEKCQDAATQHDLPNRLMRSGNLLGVYEPIREQLPSFAGKRILVADDIITTGATCNEAAKTLMIFGAERVICAAALLNPKNRPGPQKAAR